MNSLQRSAARGRRPGESGARDAILQAAREQFAERGFRAATLRDIARGAGVDVRLVSHYFGNKAKLFVAAMELPVDPGQVLDAVFDGDRESIGERAARALVGLATDPVASQSVSGLMRAAASEPEAAQLLRQLIDNQVISTFADQVSGPDADIRIGLVPLTFAGLVFAREIVGLEVLGNLDPDELARVLAPVLQYYLTGQASGLQSAGDPHGR